MKSAEKPSLYEPGDRDGLLGYGRSPKIHGQVDG
jgi:hypothetical protein